MNKSQNNLDILRHSTSHVMAAAVLEMFPEAKFAIGPSIENGFYYDFELPRTLIPEDLEILEEKMRAMIKANHPFEHAEISIEEALKDFKKLGQDYKLELIDELSKKGEEKVSIYKSGHLVDLCSGPHLDSTGEIPADAFKLTKISGAYWRGDEKNKMLQRIYGVAFESKNDLKEYLKMLEEAEKRDHRKLGKELDLFCFSDLVGPGLPLFTPKGTTLIDALKKEVESICRKYGFEKVSAPSLAKPELFEISGHAKKFGDELFHVTSGKKHQFVLKPVQCPHQTQIYASKTRSYRDLPIRYMESDKQYRAEKTGEVGGLSRVYAITVEDGHSFCRVDQVKDEIKNMVNIIKDLYSSIGLWDNHWVSLSVRDYAHPEKYIGETSDWDTCEKMLQEISDEMGLDAKKQEGEAALYGPKLDFMFKDAIGKEIQIPTVQVDFATPKRFGLEYINEKGEKVPPVMVHRAILGSYERFLVLLIEHFAGAFPLWLSPVQVAILPVSEKFEKYASDLVSKMKEDNIRVELHNQSESLGKRIREAEKQKIPYMIVVGEKEETDNSVAVRSRGTKEQEVMAVEKFIEKVVAEIKNKK
ncbi:MAG: threonine--tRNA ligase [Candidatus Moraniibacteriota bacterium]